MNEKLLIVEDEFIVANDLTNMMENAGYIVCATADSVESAKQAIDKYQPAWVLIDIFLQDDSMGTELAPYLQEKGIGFVYISANTNQSVLEIAKATHPYGFLVKPFREKDLLIMLEIARSKHESSLQFAAQKEMLLQQQLTALTNERIALENKLNKVPSTFQPLIPFDYFAYHFSASNGNIIESGAFCRIGFDEYQIMPSLSESQLNQAFIFNEQINQMRKSIDSTVLTGHDFISLQRQGTFATGILRPYQLNSTLQIISKKTEGTLQLAFFNKDQEGFDQSHKTLLCRTEKSLFNLFASLAVADANELKTFRKAIRTQPVKSSPKFDGIFGTSAALLHVLDNVEMVADTPVTVLILGESGTGKEKIAHNIHLLSSRKDEAFITVNCAAMPVDLIESELFGHEKGAFTGAIEKRIGKFEAANGGTIFFDEIGELPLESQVKLLRVLQEKKFEPVGSSKTIKVDVRIVAATNRNLEKEVGEGRFRLDLFYRLNVYPINLPPLRERKEDIPTLARHFLIKSAAELGRHQVPELSASALKQLTDYQWPGNIRELGHLMQRMLIKNRTDVLEQIEMPQASYPQPGSKAGMKDDRKTMDQIEAEHILAVLRSCNGKLTGAGGAAEILDLPPSTLTSRMKKLGIKKELFHDRY